MDELLNLRSESRLCSEFDEVWKRKRKLLYPRDPNSPMQVSFTDFIAQYKYYLCTWIPIGIVVLGSKGSVRVSALGLRV